MKLSVVIPAHNEEETVAETVEGLVSTLVARGHRPRGDRRRRLEQRRHGSGRRADRRRAPRRCAACRSPYRNGFGFAVRAGLEAFEGDAVAIVMADGSDSPEDLVSYQRLLEEGYECAFGSRFVHGAQGRSTTRARS